MKRYQEVIVDLSKSVTKIRRKRPLTEKERWRHIRLAIKPRYLGNHASQIKSYNGTLSGSRSRSFRIRYVNYREAPPGEEITMTSYKTCNKTSLSRKPYIPDKKLLLGSHGRSFRIRHEPVSAAHPGVGLTMTSYPVVNKTSLSRKHTSQLKSCCCLTLV